MEATKIVLFIAVTLLVGAPGFAQENQMKSTDASSAGRDLRAQILAASPASLGFHKESEFPNVYGVVTDWNLGDQVASIVALRDGTASLYTTSSFGIIGGQSHQQVKDAAIAYVKEAEKYFGDSKTVKEFPYPKQGKVYYYLLTYTGVRRIEASMSALEDYSDKTLPLFVAAQKELTELRSISN